MKLSIDEVLEKIGSFGRYQIALNIYFNIAYGLWWAFPVMVMVFIASEPGWKCKNNITCPFTETISLGDDNYKHRCDIPRKDWEFADDFTSVVTEFDLVCDRGSLGFVSTSVIFAGFVAGSVSVSSISDKFGRKLPLFVCGFFCCLFNFVSAFAPAFWVFALFRAIVGFMIGAYSIPMFVLTTEFSGVRHRGIAGSVVWLGYDVAIMILAGVAYSIRDWRQLTLVTGAPGVVYVTGWFFIPESVRWLLKKGRQTEAREILSKVARLNGKEMPSEKLCLPKRERLGDFRDLFSSVKMAHKTLGVWFMWFAVSFISWGISFSAPFLGGDVYVNVVISAVASLPGLPLCAALTVWFSRRKLLLVFFIGAAVGAIGALLLSDKAEHDKGYLAGKIFMSMFVAKLSAGIAFTLAYIYSAELFPTTLRNVAMGTSTAWARVSGFASAYAPLLIPIFQFLQKNGKNCYRWVVPKCNGGVDTWPKVSRQVEIPVSYIIKKRRSGMDIPLLKQFVLWRGEKRIVVGEEDLQTAKISSVFKVVPQTLYLEDDFNRIAKFPSDISGGFDATFWQDKLTMQVMGESVHDQFTGPAGSFSCGDWGNLPSPQQLGINTARPGTSSTQGKLQRNAANQLTIGKPKPKVSAGFKRVVFLAHFEDQEIVKTHTAHLRLKPEDCNVNDVAKLVKEYLNLDEDLVIVDIHGFEIMDTDSTRGKDFWNVPAKKIFAVTLSNYQRKKKRQGERGKGKNKRFIAEGEPSHLPILEEISEKLDNLTETVEGNKLLCRSITENFKCCICMKIARPLTVSGCCQRLLGCKLCVERWFERDNRCPVCKNDDGREKHFVLKGVEDFTVLISKLNEQD